MNTLVNNCLLLAFCFGVLGCDSAAQQSEALVIETDRTLYSPRDTVVVSFANERSSTVFVMTDGCLTLDRKPLPIIQFERRERGEWVPYAPGYTCTAIAQPPAELMPEDVYSVEFRVGVLPELPPGTYRYVFVVLEEAYEHETALPEEERTSNEFEVQG